MPLMRVKNLVYNKLARQKINCFIKAASISVVLTYCYHYSYQYYHCYHCYYHYYHYHYFHCYYYFYHCYCNHCYHVLLLLSTLLILFYVILFFYCYCLSLSAYVTFIGPHIRHFFLLIIFCFVFKNCLINISQLDFIFALLIQA